ncbi:CRTAC1 family protein [Aestuariibius sp. HNIBRBA575]|uniref:CRTAC1 family protein n=1 Tax=Aestuariibius sp. HNIBRBA575 TaxID=3233343 RepID=UPI0034A13704
MLGRICVTICIANAAVAEPFSTPSFVARDVPQHIYAGGWEHFVGGGVAAFDCNGDHLPELYAAGGSNPAQLMVNTTTGPGAALTFTQDTPETLSLTGVIGAYPLDVDGDAVLDLAILRVGPDVLMRGLGDCQFALFDTLGFASGDHWTTAFSATWEGDNTLPTLAFGTYVDRSDPDGPFEACDDTLLYRPDGGKYGEPTHLTPGYCALSMLFSDWNRDGHADLRISNDRHYYVRDGQEQMWAMDAQPRLYTQADNWLPYSLWGMGIASRDVTGDGFADMYLTSMGDQKFQTFDQQTGGPTWRDATYEFGTTAHRPHTGPDGRPSTGWHAAFGDVNNDGINDIFVAKGNVEQMPDAAMQDPNSLLMGQTDGTYQDLSVIAGIATMDRSRGAALVDMNLDGKLDLAVVNRRAALELYENDTAPGHWVMVDVTPLPVGSFVELRQGDQTQVQEITIGGGHASGHYGMLHFGLQSGDDIQMRVLSSRLGCVDPDWTDFAADQIINPPAGCP